MDFDRKALLRRCNIDIETYKHFTDVGASPTLRAKNNIK